jgi:transposase-like protein
MLELSRSDRSAVEAALKATRDRRYWVRLRGVLLAAEGVPIAEICRDLGCAQSSLYDWLAHWRRSRGHRHVGAVRTVRRRG